MPITLRKCKFYKPADEYEQVLLTRGYGQVVGVSMTQPPNVEQTMPRYVEQRSSNPKLQENMKMEDTNLSTKMHKLIKLGELILFCLVALVVLVSQGLVVIVLK